jgi:hypothetical protein
MTYKQIFDKWFSKILWKTEKELAYKAFLKGVEVGKHLPRKPLV